MAQHWSAFVAVSSRQAFALDKMAMENGMRDGMALLMSILRCSRSKVGRTNGISLRHAIDTAFRLYGRK